MLDYEVKHSASPSLALVTVHRCHKRLSLSLSRVVALKNSSNMWRKMKARIRAKEIKKKKKKEKKEEQGRER